MSKPSGVLVPLSPALRTTLPEAVRDAARGWQAPQPFTPLGLVTPAGVAERELHAAGWRSRGRLEADALPECVACNAEGLSDGGRVWVADSAAAVLGGGWPDNEAASSLLAELEPAPRQLLTRVLRQGDLVAVGDLLQSTREDSPAARTLARVAALRVSSSTHAAQLAQLLRDDAGAGVTPLAKVALGAALWEPWRGPWPLDPELEAALAHHVLEASDPIAGEQPPAALSAALVGLRGEQPAPSWLPPIYAAVRDALAAAPGAEPLPEPPRGWLGFVLADRGTAAEVRRARLRRAPSPVDCSRWFPELAPLDALVERALEDQTWEPVRARLRELQDDDPRWTTPERDRARATLEAAESRSAAGEATLLALRAASGEDVRETARALLTRGDPQTEPLAFAVLDRVNETPGPVDPSDEAALSQLCRFQAWRARRGSEPPQELVEALLTRGPEGIVLSEAARSADLQSVTQFLASALPVDQAVDLAQPLAGGVLLVHERADTTWDAIVEGEPAVLRPLAGIGRLPAACLATPAGLGETPYAERDIAQLGRVAVCHRVRGLPAGPSAPAWNAVTPALRDLHQAGFALGVDPLLALRETPAGWAFVGLDLNGSLTDPEPAQRADVERLLERAGTEFSDPPRSLGELEAQLSAGRAPGSQASWWLELRDFALDSYADGTAFELSDLCGRFDSQPVELRAAREVVLSLDVELWAASAGQLSRTSTGQFQLACAGLVPNEAGA